MSRWLAIALRAAATRPLPEVVRSFLAACIGYEPRAQQLSGIYASRRVNASMRTPKGDADAHGHGLSGRRYRCLSNAGAILTRATASRRCLPASVLCRPASQGRRTGRLHSVVLVRHLIRRCASRAIAHAHYNLAAARGIAVAMSAESSSFKRTWVCGSGLRKM